MELPQYTLKPHINSMLAPWIMKLLGLSILFYGGIFAVVKVGMLSGIDSIPPTINLFIVAVLITAVASQVVIYHVKFGKYRYLFFTDRIEYQAKKTITFRFLDFQEATLKQGAFNKMFNTGTLVLSKDFKVGPIPDAKQMKGYLEQLVKYYRYSRGKARVVAAAQPAQAQQPAQR